MNKYNVTQTKFLANPDMHIADCKTNEKDKVNTSKHVISRMSKGLFEMML